MKTLKLLFLITIFAGLATGCSEDDEITTPLKSKKIPTQFTGVCTPIDNLGYDIISWYDNAGDARVTGVSLWIFTSVEPIDEVTLELTGTAEIFVGAQTVKDVYDGKYDGKWEMAWKGYQTYSSPESITFRIVAHGVGTGTEGEVLGLTARWKYWMDFDGSPDSFAYFFKGKITEEL